MREREEYFTNLADFARLLIDENPTAFYTSNPLKDPTRRRELGIDLKELLTVVGILYERELGRSALENFRSDTRQPPCRR